MSEPLSAWAYAVVFGAGVLSSAMNAVAGGGSLISFPILVGLGVPPVVANATNAMAQVPGQAASAFGFWNLLPATRGLFLPLLIPTVAGSLLGGWLLTRTDPTWFDHLVPLLILVASLLLLFQPQIKQWSQKRRPDSGLRRGTSALLQGLISLYGGYFGAGMGIMMLALLGLMMEANLHELNAVKNWLGLLINLGAGVLFVSSGLVGFSVGLVLTAGCILGGFVAARFSQRLNPDRLRRAVVVLGFALTVGYFVQNVLRWSA